MKTLDLGGDAACKSTLDALCEQLCEAQKVVAQAVPPPGRPWARCPSRRRSSPASSATSEAAGGRTVRVGGGAGPCADEDPTVYAVRLDKMVTFLDAFVNSLIQEARDQLVS